MAFDKGSTHIRGVLKSEVCLRVHGQERFEQLLIAIEVLVVDVNLEPFLDSLQVLQLVLLLVKVFLGELIITFLLFTSCVHDS